MDWVEAWLRSVAQFWVVFTAWVTLAVATMPRLRDRPMPPTTVSVLVAARDEQERIAGTLERLLAQDVPVQVLVAEGPSRDGTRAIVERFRDRGVELVDAGGVPAGWVGKCWALHQAARRATGEWLLFLDADIWLAPGTVRAAVAAAQRTRSDHVTLYTGQRTRTLAGRAAQLAIGQGMLVMSPPWLVRLRGAAAGIGHFNLVRRSTYDAFGGHEALRDRVLDDVAFGHAVRRAGARTLAASGTDWAEADWAQDARGVVQATRKNAYAGVGFRPVLALVAGAFTAVMVTGGALGALLAWTLGSAWGLAATAAWLASGVPALLQVALRNGWGPASGATGPRRIRRDLLACLLVPPLQAIYVPMLWASWRASRDGVAWRGSTYNRSWVRR